MDRTLMLKPGRLVIVALVAIAAIFTGLFFSGAMTASAGHLTGTPATYTLDADFNEGTLINLSQVPADQLQLDDTTQTFDFLWIAASGRGTVVKIDTSPGNAGAVLGQYRSAPDGRGKNPSRTTVDANGNAWVTNRAEGGLVLAGTIEPGVPSINRNMGSVVRIGLEENGQCQDRHGATLADAPDGIIQTSSGLGDLLPWANTGGADNLGGVSTAFDECIINYVRVNALGTRHLSLDANNDVWVGGLSNAQFQQLDSTGAYVAGTEFGVGCGGYGGLTDQNGVVWSARFPMLRFDPGAGIPAGAVCSNTIASMGGQPQGAYGTGIDPNTGNVWVSELGAGNDLHEIDPVANVILNTYPQSWGAQGLVVDGNSHVWVAEIFGDEVGHWAPDPAFPGTHLYVGSVFGFAGTTGVAVDRNGFIWASEINSTLTRGAARIDPSAGGLGCGGTGCGAGYTLGAIDITVGLNIAGQVSANPYNYSDMTGSTIIAAPDNGTWTIIHDSNVVGQEWGLVSWTSSEPGDSSLAVTAASGPCGGPFGASQVVTDGVDLTVADGQCLKVSVSLARSSSDGDGDGINDSPILFDLTLVTNQPPDCSNAAPSQDSLWPPNHKMVDITVTGVTDPDGDPITINIDSIRQDEEVDAKGSGNFSPDGKGVGTDTAQVRAERVGDKKTPGDGRMYHIGYTASDGQATCSGDALLVGVPHDQGQGNVVIDGGPLFDSTVFVPGTQDK